MYSKYYLLYFLVLLTFIQKGKAGKCLNIWYNMSLKGKHCNVNDRTKVSSLKHNLDCIISYKKEDCVVHSAH